MKRVLFSVAGRGLRLVDWYRGSRKRRLIEAMPLPSGDVRVFYGFDGLPSSAAVAQGGMIKIQRLSEFFPNAPRSFNLLYMVSSRYPRDALMWLDAARCKGVKFVWNQDGVAYPAWRLSGWEQINQKLAAFLHAADYVFYQSKFAMRSSEHFLGRRTGPSEVLYNAVDTRLFVPATTRLKKTFTLLVVGSQYQFAPLEVALRAFVLVRRRMGMRIWPLRGACSPLCASRCAP